MSNVRQLREHDRQLGDPDTTENRLRMRGFWPLVEEVCAKHHVLPLEVCERRSRYGQEISRARGELFARMMDRSKYGAAGVARIFGIDHSTVLYHVKRHKGA